nr:hypothetical protein CFP56_04254 [Quercus suber]
MAGQQEIRNPFLDRVLVLAVAADEFAARDARLHEQGVQIAEGLRGDGARCVLALGAGGRWVEQRVRRRGLLWEGREAELWRTAKQISMHPDAGKEAGWRNMGKLQCSGRGQCRVHHQVFPETTAEKAKRQMELSLSVLIGALPTPGAAACSPGTAGSAPSPSARARRRAGAGGTRPGRICRSCARRFHAHGFHANASNNRHRAMDVGPLEHTLAILRHYEHEKLEDQCLANPPHKMSTYAPVQSTEVQQVA